MSHAKKPRSSSKAVAIPTYVVTALDKLRTKLSSRGSLLEISPVTRITPEGRNKLAEQLLWAFVLEGIPEAFEVLYEVASPTLARLIQETMRRNEGGFCIDDILSETFWHIYRHAHSFESQGPRSFDNWALAIANNVIRQEARRRSRQSAREQVAAVREVDSQSNPLAKLVLREETLARQEVAELLKSHLDTCIQSLPDVTRRCLELVVNGGLKYRQVGEELGISEAAVTMRIRRARARAAEALRKPLTDLASGHDPL